jgi:hypothetical protein
MAASNRAWRQYVPRHSLFHERVKTDQKKEEKGKKTKTKRQHCTRLSVPAALVVVLRHERGDIYCRPYRERRELRAITDIYLTGIEGLVLAFQRERGRIFCILFLFPTTTTTRKTRKKEKKKKDDWNRDMRCSPLSVNKDNNRQAAEDVHITLFIGC